MQRTYQDILDTAIEAAIEGGKITLQYFQTGSFQVETKADNSPVTVADRLAEQRIREIIVARFPDHGVLGEEHGEQAGTGGTTWIIDPIDGTKSFIRGVPLYGVMIGVEIDGEVEVGVVNFPALGEIYYAMRGCGTYWNGRRCRVSAVSDMGQAALLTTDAKHYTRETTKAEAHARLMAATKIHRTWGDCYGHILVASGRAEIMLDPKMSVWDCAPLKVILEEAGGHFTDWNGTPTIHGGEAISTNSALHGTVLEIVRNDR
ncbi:MAG: putative 28 [Chlorobi bacterium]|nr:putative 28 [Chlorobiota bacterium]